MRWGPSQPLVGMLLAASVLPASAGAQNLERLTQRVIDIEGEAEVSTRQPLRASARRSSTFVEERLTDGELFYRLQDYIRASIIFTDIVDNYADHPAYPDALFLLADSLFRAGDFLGSRTRFREVLGGSGDAAYAPYLQRTLGRLIEIAIHTRDFDGVEDYFARLSRIPPGEIEATTTYFRGKYLYNRAVPTEDVLRGASAAGGRVRIDSTLLDEARQAFEAVAEGSPYFAQARYFVGVIYTLREQYPQAIEAFRRVLRSPADTEEERDVLELTQLALGRLYYETEQLDQAVEAYQAIQRTSANFPTALYEIAWVYIRMGDSTRAERALEVLGVAAPDSPYIPDGKLLRGNLLLRNGRLDDANEIFREVAREFGPVRRELDDIVSSHDDPQAYFRTLVRENMETFDANAFLPPLAQRWASLEGDMDRALGVLSDLAQARRLVRETTDLVARLTAALDQPNGVAIFSDLRSAREQTSGLRARIAQTRQALMEAYDRRHPGEGDEASEVARQRRAIERFLEGMPVSESDFADFDGEVLGRYRTLERELGRMEVELQGMEARITAMDRYLRDTEEERDPEGVAAIRAELVSHRGSVDEYREQVRQLRIALEAAQLQVGPGDARHQRNDRLRRQYAALVEQERQVLRSRDPDIAQLLGRLETVEDSLDRRDREIDEIVTERSTEIRRQLEEESGRIVGYRQALTELELETEAVVGGVTYDNFVSVRDRFFDLVLRADVGRIDVGWGRREEHRMRIEMLTRDRAEQMRALDDEFREIVGDDVSGSSESTGDDDGEAP
jgi:TolA-binding protein